MAIEIVVVPNLRTSHVKASQLLKQLGHDALFLNFPENMEPLVKDLTENRLSYRDFVDEVRERRLIPEPVEGWRYTAEPILKMLREIKLNRPELEICCYKDVNCTRFSAEIASKIARLTLRITITGKIKVQDWKDAIGEGVEHASEALHGEADSIHERGGHRCNCVSGLEGENLERLLRKRGDAVTWTNVEEFYQPTPLEILEDKLTQTDIFDDEVEELIKAHLEYVKNYILTSKNRDQAYYQWVYDKVPALRSKIDSEEIKQLDALICPDEV